MKEDCASMKHMVTFVVAAILVFLCVGCDRVTEPPPQNADTTSHNFIWDQTILLGGADPGLLSDVAIINDTLAFAVGEIYITDSLGKVDPVRYNLVMWNGSSWATRELKYDTYSPVIHSVWAIGDRDVWLDPSFHWDGNRFAQVPVDSMFAGIGITRMWGSKKNSLYAIG